MVINKFPIFKRKMFPNKIIKRIINKNNSPHFILVIKINKTKLNNYNNRSNNNKQVKHNNSKNSHSLEKKLIVAKSSHPNSHSNSSSSSNISRNNNNSNSKSRGAKPKIITLENVMDLT